MERENIERVWEVTLMGSLFALCFLTLLAGVVSLWLHIVYAAIERYRDLQTCATVCVEPEQQP